MNRPSRRSFSFVVPDASAERIGAALGGIFPDGVLHQPCPGGRTRLQGWLPAGRAELSQAQKRLLAALGIGRLRRERPAPSKPTKPFGRFPPRRVGPFRILAAGDPALARRPRPPRTIVLTQGQAFGSGRHESTLLMLRALCARPPAGTVLDVGAGSGILGFACLELGAERVVAVEQETAACAELRANRDLNSVEAVRLPVLAGRFPLRRLEGRRFATVLANLVTPVLVDLMPALSRALAPGGALLCCGIHTRPEALRVARAARSEGLAARGEGELRGWRLLRLTRA